MRERGCYTSLTPTYVMQSLDLQDSLKGPRSQQRESAYIFRIPISLIRCILKTGLVFKISGGIPISAARASVGGVWPRAKYGCCSALCGQKPGVFFLVQVLWHLQLTY